MKQQTASDFKLELRGDTEIVITQSFDAPRELVWRAHTSCEHIKNWWGPRSTPVEKCEMDFRVGGRWRFVCCETGTDTEHAFRGEYREISEPEVLSYTFEYEGFPGHISTETMTLEEKDGRTYATAVAQYASKEDRDGMAQSGMEQGARETYERLAELVSEWKK